MLRFLFFQIKTCFINEKAILNLKKKIQRQASILVRSLVDAHVKRPKAHVRVHPTVSQKVISS